jgi:NAD(P)-dependent dehydrogenase (short-subunit alcohol dehydrogenase family)
MTFAKTILITGVSSGFGRALAQEALAAGHRVIGTVRNREAKQAFEACDAERALGACLMSRTLRVLMRWLRRSKPPLVRLISL